MASFTQENDIVGSGYGFGGGGWAILLLIVVVLWCLFKGDHKDGYGVHDGYYGGRGRCGVCVEDESNWEEDKHLTERICKVDMDVWKTSCETQKEVHCEAEKTRALIEANYIQDLRDQLAAEKMCNQTLKQEFFIEKKTDILNAKIDALACSMPKVPTYYAQGFINDCGDNIQGKRCNSRRSGCNDNYGYDGNY